MTHGYFQIVAGAEDNSAGDATELKWEFDEDLVLGNVVISKISYAHARSW